MNKITSFFGKYNPVLVDLNSRAKSYALSKGFDYEWIPYQKHTVDYYVNKLNDTDAAIIDTDIFDSEIFSKLNGRTRLLVRFGVGYDAVDLNAASNYGIAIARTTGANATGVAEMALTLLLACKRQLTKHNAIVLKGAWESDYGNELTGSTVGILGFGKTSEKLIKYLHGLDCSVLVFDYKNNKEKAEEFGVELADLSTIFAQADAISIHLPLAPNTEKLVDEKLLSLMKPNAVIVNTARGKIIDEKALYLALKSKKIAAAGLDVLADEPIVRNHPFLELDNIILTPHISSQTLQSLWSTYVTAIDIIDEFTRTGNTSHLLNK